MDHPGPPSEDEHLFRLLVDGVRDYAIFLLDPGGRIRSWNAGAERLKGYTAEEIIGRHFSIFYPPQDIRHGKPDYELRIATDEGRYEEEGWRLRKDGSRFWANVIITSLHAADGGLIGFAKITRDLTDRRRREDERASLLSMERTAREQAELALEQVRAIHSVTEAMVAPLTLDELLNAVLDRIVATLGVDTVAILLLDQAADVLVTRAAHGIEEEVERGVRIPVGHGFAGRIASERTPIVLDEIERANVLNPILRDKGLQALLGVPLLVEGRVIGVLHVGSIGPRRFTAADTQFLQVVGDRVAHAIDRAQLFEEARTARQEADVAEAGVRARDEFLAVAAHELKTPLTSAKAAAQLLGRLFRQGGSLDAPQTRALETVEQQIDRLARLVTQLLETVRIEADRMTLTPAVTDLVALSREVADQVTATTGRGFAIAGPDAVHAEVDPLRMEQVIRNLADNAVKFSAPESVVEIAVSQPAPEIAAITVRDHGIGVAPAERSRLFERFYQAKSKARSGMGLGLYITRQIVERHGGTIFAEFPPDGGTRFVISLPIKAEVEEPTEHVTA